MRVIDLLVKISNGEEVPKKIKIGNSPFELTLCGNHYSGNTASVLNNVIGMGKLNDEIEIIEEDNKIDKLDTSIINALRYDYEKNKEMTISNIASDFLSVSKAINELVDEVNKLKENSNVKD